MSEGRKIGEALEAYYKNFQGIKAKKPAYKMAMFLIVKGATIGKVDLLTKYGGMYKALGVKIYIIGGYNLVSYKIYHFRLAWFELSDLLAMLRKQSYFEQCQL